MKSITEKSLEKDLVSNMQDCRGNHGVITTLHCENPEKIVERVREYIEKMECSK